MLIGMSGAASAQSVLERVLAQTNAIQDVTGIFANTADNIGGETTRTVYLDTENDVLLSQEEFDAIAGQRVQEDFTFIADTDAYVNPTTGEIITETQFNALSAADRAGFVQNDDGAGDELFALANDGTIITVAERNALLTQAGLNTRLGELNAQVIQTGAAGLVDGSISIDLRELSGVNATIEGQLNSIQAVTGDIGNMSTTVLGAVNTGEIALGSNIVVEEAVAGTSEAVRGTITQLGSQTDQTVMALNSALNTMNIDGSIDVTMTGVNATIGRSGFETMEGLTFGDLAGLNPDAISALVGGLSTTAIGAVNTGEITSGVNGQVDGTVSSIVGNTAANLD